jgi:hypothetical protein
MAVTLELSADYHGPQGRIVTDYHNHRLPSITAALAVTESTWQRVGRRRGTQLHVRITPDDGMPIVTRRFRRD